MNKVWVVMYTESNTGVESIKGIFSNEEKAKDFIYKFVLSESVITEYLELAEKEIF